MWLEYHPCQLCHTIFLDLFAIKDLWKTAKWCSTDVQNQHLKEVLIWDRALKKSEANFSYRSDDHTSIFWNSALTICHFTCSWIILIFKLKPSIWYFENLSSTLNINNLIAHLKPHIILCSSASTHSFLLSHYYADYLIFMPPLFCYQSFSAGQNKSSVIVDIWHEITMDLNCMPGIITMVSWHCRLTINLRKIM